MFLLQLSLGGHRWFGTQPLNMARVQVTSQTAFSRRGISTIKSVPDGAKPSRDVDYSRLPSLGGLFHGAKDAVVPPQRLEEIAEALKANRGEYISLHFNPDTDHDS